MKDVILYGDCRLTLKQFADAGVKAQMCVTSPPYYGLRDYGNEDNQIGLEESPEEFIAQLVEVFRGVRDVLADDGTLWVNIGDSYYNYRSGKGQTLPKQSVASNNQDLPQIRNPRRGNKLEGLKDKDLIGSIVESEIREGSALASVDNDQNDQYMIDHNEANAD